MPGLRTAVVICLTSAWLAAAAPASADEKNGRLDIYFIDVEGGAATLLVTPAGESVLIDSGYPDNGGRDRDRILKVLGDVAGRQHLDHACVSHWHLDHFGNHAALASQISIKNFWDRGIPEALEEDPAFPERVANYRAAAQNASKTLKPGDKLPVQSGKTPLSVKVVTASGEVIANDGPANPYAAEHRPQDDDRTDNARSVSQLWQFGKFKFLTCGDLTWNTEAKLVTPNNPIGQVDLFMVTHHGLNSSNNPTLVWAIDPRVTVMCNGPTKGGAKETQATLRKVKSLKAAFQLHRNIELEAGEQTPAEFIANSGPTENCEGIYIKASVAPDGKSYTVQIGEKGKVLTFETR
ncbi:MAG: MBL fold metallo-hydrolase [Planctomycetaceae bacterium]|nr:MBL fold metallo-hydrolase [Planctomycetaceae bacterium]